MVRAAVEVLINGLGHPEGPDVLPDGRIVFAHTLANEVAVCDPAAGSKATYAFTGGGPHACVYGTDGCLYVTQAPSVGAWTAPEARPPSIQRIEPDGKVALVATAADGHTLTAPNDLAFGADGNLYFTDSGIWDPARRADPGLIAVVHADGSCHVLAEVGHVYPNGIVAEPDGSIVWVESYTRNVVRRQPHGEIQVLTTLPDGHIPDGLKIDADANFWIATCGSGGIDVISSSGESIAFVETGGIPLNCTFGETSLFVCDAGAAPEGSTIEMIGRLFRFDAGIEGMPRFRGSIQVSPSQTIAAEVRQ